jgi:peptidyl-prolyl cis-trans isomerase SurA
MIRRVMAVLVLLAALLAQTARGVLVDGIKAVVHDSVVTFHAVEFLTSQTRAAEELRRQYGSDPKTYDRKLNEVLNENMETLVERQIIIQEFKSAGYNMPETLIEEEVQTRIKARFGDRRTATKTLQAQGITYEKFREQIRDQFIVEALRGKYISQEIIISPYKVEQYYLANQDKYKLEDQVKLRMIVLKKGSAASPAVRARADEIQTKLKEGADFKEMATLYSEGSQRAQGGDWGWAERSTLRKELADAAFALKAGDVSPVVELPDACYILKVEEVKPAHVRPLKEVRNEVEQVLLTKERKRVEDAWIEKLRKKTFVRYY